MAPQNKTAHREKRFRGEQAVFLLSSKNTGLKNFCFPLFVLRGRRQRIVGSVSPAVLVTAWWLWFGPFL
ncbi:MAG: hypothetical protein H8F28_15685 [Fibrella sp.]|nr:hypothetical protein [Armatimonadota bacterium]